MESVTRFKRASKNWLVLSLGAAIAMVASVHSQAAGGQTTASSNDRVLSVLLALRAPKWTTRADAFDKLKVDAAALQRSDVRRALLDLLDREDQLIESALRESHEQVGASTKYGEGFVEYVGQLSETIDTFADWTDPHQVCVLVRKAYDADSRTAAKIAMNGRLAVPCLLSMFKSEVGLTRAQAVGVLIQALAKSKNDLDAETTKRARNVAQLALSDRSDAVRIEAVEALGRFGDSEMVPALQRVAESDPAISHTSHTFWIREAARKAIGDIGKRALQAR